jgi:predicted nucleotidyltransferase
MKSIQKARQRSEEGVTQIRRIASEVFGSETGLIIGVNGSYARREATAGSDIDLFYLLSTESMLDTIKRQTFEKMVRDAGFKLPAEGGVFEDVLQTEDLLKNIGGLDDTNTSLTRRMLLLLEGEWLHNKDGYIKARHELLARYVTDRTPKNKIALFLLNDIIRYWRTMCVDYEYKTSDGRKPRGIRLVKLRFSRMYLAFGGIVAVAETIDLAPEQKRQRLEELFSLDVLKRVESTMGDHARRTFVLYDEFLAALDDEVTRGKLSSSEYESAVEFADLRKKGREFKDELLASLASKYPAKHPIHKALLL